MSLSTNEIILTISIIFIVGLVLFFYGYWSGRNSITSSDTLDSFDLIFSDTELLNQLDKTNQTKVSNTLQDLYNLIGKQYEIR